MHDIAFNIAKNTKHDGYQRILVSMVFLIKKTSARRANKFAGGAIKNENYVKPIIRKFEK